MADRPQANAACILIFLTCTLCCSHLSYTYGPDWAQTAPRTKDGWLKLKPLREMLVGGPDGLTAGHPCRESDELRPVAMELQQAVMAQEAAAGGDQDVTFRQVRTHQPTYAGTSPLYLLTWVVVLEIMYSG